MKFCTIGFIAVSFLFNSACKANKRSLESDLLDTSAPRQAGFAPGTHYALKSSIRNLFESIRMVQSGVEDGAYVYTVTEMNFSGFENNLNGVTGSILLNLSVDASKSQAVTRRVDAGVNLSFSGQAKVLVDVMFSGSNVSVVYRGIEWTMPLTHRINTWTNARLLRGVVHRKAMEAAAAAVPETKRTIAQKVDQELRSGISSQTANFQNHFAEIAMAMNDVPGALPKLTSDRAGAYFQHHIGVRNPGAVKNPPNTPSEVEAGFLFHQDMFSVLLGNSLAGKKIDVKDLAPAVCRSFSRSLFKFCKSGNASLPVDISLTFPKSDAVKFEFESNSITLTMRATIGASTNDQTYTYLRSMAANVVESFQLQGGPADIVAENTVSSTPGTEVQINESSGALEKVSHVTPEVEIKIVYKLETRRFLLSTVDAKIVTPNDKGGFLTRHQLYRDGMVAMLKKKIGESLPAAIEVPAAPTYASSNQKVHNMGGSLVVMKTQHFGIKDNWLYAYFSYCSASDTQTSLGINMRSIKDASDISRLLVSNVSAGTPSSKAKVLEFKSLKEDEEVEVDYRPAPGLMVGDVIYSVDKIDQLVASPEIFSGTLAGKSLTPNSKVTLKVGRKETLEGLDKPVWMIIEFEVQLRPVCRSAS